MGNVSYRLSTFGSAERGRKKKIIKETPRVEIICQLIDQLDRVIVWTD